MAKEQYWSSVQQTQMLLKNVVPKDMSETNTVAVAGSSPLYWYQECHMVGPLWSGPNDVDIFVTGSSGETNEKFWRFVDEVERCIDKAGYHVTFRDKKVHKYISDTEVSFIIDMTVAGLDNVLSFVQCPDCETVKEVVDNFDISVCKVMYHIHEETFQVQLDVQEDIANSRFILNPLRVKVEGSPSRRELDRWSSSMERVKKYTDRGFQLVNEEECVLLYHTSDAGGGNN
jgi:hypothetical protein